MKAAETVMTKDAILKAIREKYRRPDLELEHITTQDLVIVEAQAEISFPAGLKEVVDFTEKLLGMPVYWSNTDAAKQWLDQKEKWGLDQPSAK